MRLFYHPESDSYFVDELDEDAPYPSDGFVENVTGYTEHEVEAYKRGVFTMYTGTSKSLSEIDNNPKTEEEKANYRTYRNGLPRIVGNAITKYISGYDLVASCLSCTEFHEESETCMKYRQRPPARVIAFGCPSYSDKDEIPY